MLALAARRFLRLALVALSPALVACTTDQEVGSSGGCLVERDNTSSCADDSDCEDLGASCIDSLCMCEEWFCNVPPQTGCRSDTDCGNYPGSTCGADGACVCPVVSQ